MKPKIELSPCNHKCHTTGLNPWVEECPVCHCPNPKYDPANAERLKEEFIQEMEGYGWRGFRESLAITEAAHGRKI